MSFNSLEFFLFFIVILAILRTVPHALQNWLLLFSSYVFYACWDWRFVGLLAASTLVDYYCGIQIEQANAQRRRRELLWLSVCVNLGMLACFKYFNFFADNFLHLAGTLGWHPDPVTLNIVLPVGISFYTFQTMSYTLDIYRGQMAATRRLPDFALYVAFFPQLVAGPIERASHLLPQVLRPRSNSFKQFGSGCFLIIWGLYEKVFIADNLGRLVDPVFATAGAAEGGRILIGLYAFAFQIFCDFDGYSNMARGLGKCLGFEIVQNFRLPYLAGNPREFWRRWHISLSNWLRDYLYIPLGGNRGGPVRLCRNVAVTMVLGGLWHGAGWNFVLWGVYHAVLVLLHRWVMSIAARKRFFQNSRTARRLQAVQIVFFFHLVCAGWLIFRAGSLPQVGALAADLAQAALSHPAGFFMTVVGGFAELAPYLWLLLIVHGRAVAREGDPLAVFEWPASVRSALYAILVCSIMLGGVYDARAFFYTRF